MQLLFTDRVACSAGLSVGLSVTLVSPEIMATMAYSDDIKDKFYDELSTLITAVPRADKNFILGDFNARVGADHHTWNGIIGKQGIGKCNSNGLLLLKMCAAHDLSITNTMFCLPTVRRRPGCIHDRNIGTSSTISSSAGNTGRMSE